LALSTKRLVAASKFLVAARKKIFVVPNFVAVAKLFFSVFSIYSKQTPILNEESQSEYTLWIRRASSRTGKHNVKR